MSQSTIDIDSVLDAFEQSFQTIASSGAGNQGEVGQFPANSAWSCQTSPTCLNCSASPSPCGNTYLGVARCPTC